MKVKQPKKQKLHPFWGILFKWCPLRIGEPVGADHDFAMPTITFLAFSGRPFFFLTAAPKPFTWSWQRITGSIDSLLQKLEFSDLDLILLHREVYGHACCNIPLSALRGEISVPGVTWPDDTVSDPLTTGY